MECPKEFAETLKKFGWYERGNGTWSHQDDGNKHRTWDEVITGIIENYVSEGKKKATTIETSVEGLSISIGDDGLWMNFSADGKHACVNISLDAAQREDWAVLAWCKATAKKYCA